MLLAMCRGRLGRLAGALRRAGRSESTGVNGDANQPLPLRRLPAEYNRRGELFSNQCVYKRSGPCFISRS